jgi:hypothetical protein
MRAPARLIFVLDFALAGLAALGLDTLLEDSQQGRSVLKSVLRVGAWVLGAIVLFVVPLSYFAVITNQDKDPVIFARTSAAANGVVFFAGLLAASLVLLYLFQRRYFRPFFVGALAVGLLFVDLASLGSNVDVGHGDPGQAFEHPAIIDFLKSDTSLYRIDSRTDVWHLWQPNTSLIHDIFDVAGLVNPLTLADYDTYLQAVPDRSSALFDFLNAKYVIAAKDVVLDWDKFVPVFDADPALNVYLNRNALPRAWLVHRALVVSDHDAALAAIQAADFDPATQVILEAGQPLSTTAGDSSDISFDVYDLNRIHLQVDTPGDGYLVLSEVWYPGWQVRVDGVSTPLLRANYAFRAVSLSPGQHQVEMVFRPTSWLIGLALSVFTCLCLLVWLGVRLLAKSQTS